MWKQFDTVTTRLTGGTKEPRPCEQEGDKVPQERKERRRKSSADLVSFQEKNGIASPVSRLVGTNIYGDYVVCNASGWWRGAQTLGSSKRLRFVERRRGWDGP
jgi:hypothetical protein